ncbi:hypothetical protein GW924_03375 [Candidatus Pacearchaeota archaeon]|nr:hypothetical protein [Candidatus Pacearchaeota archaeon]
MVEEIILRKKKFYRCEDCKLFYSDNYYAEKCEEWCKKHKTCNIKITKNAIKEIK